MRGSGTGIHIWAVAGALFIMLVVPVLFSAPFKAFITGGSDMDAISSASVIIDKPGGEYVVFINRALHSDSDKLAIWEDFFLGREIPVIFEDIHCEVPDGDTAGYDMAVSYMSRLPKNQMTVDRVNGTLLLSKADNGRYDILIMSKEYYDAYEASSVEENEDSVRLFIDANT